MALDRSPNIIILESIGNGEVSDLDISDEEEDLEEEAFKRFNRGLDLDSESSDSDSESDDEMDMGILSTSNTLPEGTLNDITWTKLPFHDVNVVLDDLEVPEPVISLRTPIDYFMQYFDKGTFENIAINTNIYAAKNNATNFKPTNKKEIQTLIAIHLIIDCIKPIYWESCWEDSISLIPIIFNAMSLERFKELRNNLHIINNLNIPENNQDKFIKVRPLYNQIKKKFNELPKSRRLAIGEQIVPYKRTLKVRKYDSDNVGPWCVKLFVLVSDVGMVYDFILFQENCSTELNQNNLKQFGFGPSIVLHFVENLKKNSHFLAFDHRFATSQMFKHLHSLGFYITATVKPKCFGNPPLLSKQQMSKLGKGTSFEISSKVQNNDCTIGLVKWWHNHSLILASNYTTTGSVEKLECYDTILRRYVIVEVPNILTSYSKCMYGLEKFQKKLSSYRTVIKSKKWTLQLIINAFNLAATNAWLQYNKDAEDLSIPKKKRLSCTEFRFKLCSELIGDLDSRIVPDHVRYDQMNHFPSRDNARNGTKCKNPTCSGNRRTHFYCKKCNVHLCLRRQSNCFREFHTDDTNKENV